MHIHMWWEDSIIGFTLSSLEENIFHRNTIESCLIKKTIALFITIVDYVLSAQSTRYQLHIICAKA